MKRNIFFAMALLLVATAPFLYGAFTNPASNINWTRTQMRNNSALDLWIDEVEDRLDGTTAAAGIKLSTVKLGSTTLTLPGADGTNGQQLTTNGSGTLSWAGAGATFTGGNISSDVTLNADGVDIQGTTTTAHTFALKAYDNNSGPAYVDVLRWTNGDIPAVVLGAGTSSFALASTALDISTAGALTNAASIAGANGNTVNLAINQRFEFTDNSETFGLDVGTTGNTVEFCTDSGVTTVDCNDVDQLIDVEYITGDLGVKIDLSINERVEFGDTEKIGFGLGTGNTVEWCTDSGITTMDFNDVDQLTDVEYMAGDNGAKIDLSINERVEFKDGAETVGFILNGSNKIEWATDSGVTELDFNDVDQLTDVEYVAGDSGSKVDLSINERVEFKDAGETFGFILNGANKIELATDSGVDTLDFNDVDALEDIQSITGEGTGALAGFLLTIFNDTDNEILTAADVGTVNTNSGAGGTQTYTLPAAVAGMHYTFVVVTDAQELRIDPEAGDKINIAGVAGDNGEYWTANAIGESLTLVAVSDAIWVATAYTGTWTQQNP